VQPEWLDNGGIALASLRTPWGKLGYTLQREGNRIVWHIDGGVAPPGGVLLTWPWHGRPGATRVNGKPSHWSQGELRVPTLPATVTAESAAATAANPPGRSIH